MKLTLGICILACVLAISAGAATYTNKFDSVNVDSVLSNERILSNYLKCLMDKGPCTAEGRELKRVLADALANNCAKCTDIQRKNSEKVIHYLEEHRGDDWKLLLEKYDPSGIYAAQHIG